jgi:threonine synthase
MGSVPFALHCLECGQHYDPADVTYFCPRCELDGALDVVFDYDSIGRRFIDDVKARRSFDMWRYSTLLPVDMRHAPRLHTGGSPLYRLSHDGPGRIFVKDDSRNPSGSLKDRASALAVALAAESGERTIATASTGNAAAALACMSAGSAIRCVIFAPSSASPEKLAQIRAYGADVFEVEGGYDEAFAACHTVCKANGWYNRSTGINSYMTEGKKTVAFEICEQMQWSVPDRVFVPVGNGCIVGAVYKGFHELRLMGCIDRIPKITGVQAEGSDFIRRAWESGTGPHGAKRIPPRTAASGIGVSLPRDRIKAYRAIEQSDGDVVVVTDKQIFEALSDLACTSGVFVEPAAAAAYAGARKRGALQADETAVVLVTGSGLKDISGLIRSGILDRPHWGNALYGMSKRGSPEVST